MGLLQELGVHAAPGVMLVSAPDSVMAEAGAMKPRPAFASSIMTAEPADHILWWPEPRYLANGALSRLRWLLKNGGPGGAWLVLDADDDALPTLDALRDLVTAAGLAVAGERTFAGGRALHLVLPPG